MMSVISPLGHLKRFMRGIAELVEVTKSSPPTPSSALPPVIPPPCNGLSRDSGLPDDEDDISKTPEPSAETPPTPVQNTPTPIPLIDKSNEIMRSSNFAKMKNMLAMNMGISTEGQEVIEDTDSHSPIQSPVTQRKAVKAPPPPKRGSQTAVGANRNSLSSSSSSLSSNQSERVQGSYDVRKSVEVPMATQQQLASQIPVAKMASQSPSRRELG
jgi:hypothetical protein